VKNLTVGKQGNLMKFEGLKNQEKVKQMSLADFSGYF